MAFNIVEAIQDKDADTAFDQPCKYGHRVEDHAVYCHNDAWTDGPRKCRRSWYTGGETKDEDCPGFQPNPEFKGELHPTPLVGTPCTKCGGTKLINGDRETVETCPLCMGDGSEPHAMELTQFEQDTLELGVGHSGKHPAHFENEVRTARNRSESEQIGNLDSLSLIQVRSISSGGPGCTVFLYRLTPKGDAVMRANWAARKPS